MTELVLLGTAGGRTWHGGGARQGISSAVVVEGQVYLVDCGEGWGRRYREAELGSQADFAGLERLRAVFVTHLHADHIVDYPNLFLFGLNDGLGRERKPVEVIGPGPRGALPPPAPGADGSLTPIEPGEPTPGMCSMTSKLIAAYATDLNDAKFDGLKADPRELLRVRDIALPTIPGLDPNGNPSPSMAPVDVYEDELVRVRAILVSHRPVFPAYAFRFDTADGSVVFSGDTAPCDNLTRLASGADCLAQEVIDRQWVESTFPSPRSVMAEAKRDHLLNAHTQIDDLQGIGDRSEARTMVLTHFGPASRPTAAWEKVRDCYQGDLIIGEDLMRLAVCKSVGVRIDG